MKAVHVYVAGPISSDDPLTVEMNVQRAMDAADELEDAGLRPFIPHMSHFRQARRPRPYEEWMAIDADWLRRCDVLLRLPGPSKGADREVEMALHLGMHVYHSAAELIAAAKRDAG